jgi:hypothetical protein
VPNRKRDDDEKRPIVEGKPITDIACPRCLSMQVIEAYAHYSTRLMFCTKCEHSWVIE